MESKDQPMQEQPQKKQGGKGVERQAWHWLFIKLAF
jgi:hypothetical protein